MHRYELSNTGNCALKGSKYSRNGGACSNGLKQNSLIIHGTIPLKFSRSSLLSAIQIGQKEAGTENKRPRVLREKRKKNGDALEGRLVQ
jgi:hypothetical protein